MWVEADARRLLPCYVTVVWVGVILDHCLLSRVRFRRFASCAATYRSAIFPLFPLLVGEREEEREEVFYFTDCEVEPEGRERTYGPKIGERIEHRRRDYDSHNKLTEGLVRRGSHAGVLGAPRLFHQPL